jgi:hypothetical protein
VRRHGVQLARRLRRLSAHHRSQGAGGAGAPSQDKLSVLEAYWEQARAAALAVAVAESSSAYSALACQVGPQSAVPAEDVVARLAAETGFSPAQVQRWFSRRVLSQTVARPPAAARGAAPASAALADAFAVAAGEVRERRCTLHARATGERWLMHCTICRRLPQAGPPRAAPARLRMPAMTRRMTRRQRAFARRAPRECARNNRRRRR